MSLKTTPILTLVLVQKAPDDLLHATTVQDNLENAPEALDERLHSTDRENAPEPPDNLGRDLKAWKNLNMFQKSRPDDCERDLKAWTNLRMLIKPRMNDVLEDDAILTENLLNEVSILTWNCDWRQRHFLPSLEK